MDDFDKSKDQMISRGLIDPYDLHPDPNRWIVLKEYVFWSARLQQKIIVPRWMHTDLASVPKIMRWLISVNEEHRFASIVHDFGYGLGVNSSQPKEVWDELLFDFSKAFGTPKWKYYSLYWAVKLFGDEAWKKRKDMFAPLEHRLYYCAQYPSLNLTLDTGKYTNI